jgi:predicted GIY-YIG superfamily endonuclease
MPYTVYVLRSEKSGRLITGTTQDMEKHLIDHNSGRVEPTKLMRPMRLLHFEVYGTPKEAASRERELRTSRGRDDLRKLLGTAFGPG